MRVLGVPVGTVETVEPAGTDVKVRWPTTPRSSCPPTPRPSIVAPSIVGDRYVQLTPVYTERRRCSPDGAELDGGADRGAARARPDLQSLDDLTVALGPNGANSDGALTDLLAVTADNFDGQGEQFNETIERLRPAHAAPWTTTRRSCSAPRASSSGSSSALADNDQTVRDFNDSRSPTSPTCSRASGRSSPPRCATSAIALARSSGLRQGEPRGAGRATSRASTGSPRCWSSSATPSTRSSRSRRWHWPTSP